MATDKTVSINVHGIRELRSALKRVDSNTPNAMKAAFTEVAEGVASSIRGMMPKRSGRAAGSVRGKGRSGGGSIAAGGSAAPYYPWLDFGGTTGRGHRPGVAFSGSIRRQWMGKDVQEPAGRYLYPTISREGKNIRRDADEALERVVRNAGFEQRGSD